MAGRRFVYGPVASRRLGFSLGVDIIPYKTCTLDCVYCQLGSTGKTTARRRSFVPPAKVLAQVRAAVASGTKIDVITFSGSGEPTLNKDIGRLIRAIKRTTRIPVAVLTNGTLLTRRDVRRDLAAADIVVPSLDAVPAALFRRVNRPHAGIASAGVVDGLARFRDEFAGEIRLEVMLVKGINDSPAAIAALKAAVARIRPDRIELNTVVRPPAERRAGALGPADLEKVRAALGPRARIVAPFSRRKPAPAAGGLERAVLATVARRPQTAEDIAVALGRHRDEVLKTLAALLTRGRARVLVHGGRTYFAGRGA
ncbi:MAG TPA: radical SAM protein [Candidatus Aminicenantes bacterium]|nr:radical SAM protein [Candidatus Aminicenantes bacterium]